MKFRNKTNNEIFVKVNKEWVSVQPKGTIELLEAHGMNNPELEAVVESKNDVVIEADEQPKKVKKEKAKAKTSKKSLSDKLIPLL